MLIIMIEGNDDEDDDDDKYNYMTTTTIIIIITYVCMSEFVRESVCCRLGAYRRLCPAATRGCIGN